MISAAAAAQCHLVHEFLDDRRESKEPHELLHRDMQTGMEVVDLPVLAELADHEFLLRVEILDPAGLVGGEHDGAPVIRFSDSGVSGACSGSVVPEGGRARCGEALASSPGPRRIGIWRPPAGSWTGRRRRPPHPPPEPWPAVATPGCVRRWRQ